MLDVLKNSNVLKFFISIQQMLVGILIALCGLILIFLPFLKSYVTIDAFLQYILLVIGLPSFLLGLYILYRQYNKAGVDLDDTFEKYEINNYRDFITNLNLDEFDEIILMIHTGRNSLEILRQKMISNNVTCNIDIKILIKNPYSETTDRFEQIDNYLQSFLNEMNRYPNSNIDYRFYNGAPYFHTILCKYKNGNQYKSYISYYKWNKHRTVACKTGTVIDRSETELFLVAKSLFEHLFSKKNLHTIVFDLDDTIIDSYNSQIRSWKFLLESILDDSNELHYLREKIKLNKAEDLYEQYIEKMFLETTDTDERIDYIFDNLTHNERETIKKIRFNKREELTIDEANLFLECRKTLTKLSKTYNLVIISATSENLVKKVLDKYDLNSYFSFYLGIRDNQVESFDKAENKTPHLIKTSNLLGIPFERIAFIGDSQTDFKAAKQLNIKFIAANMVATRLRQHPSSFITGHNGLSFNSYKNDSLLNIIQNNFN